jgi:hypothetical protein
MKIPRLEDLFFWNGKLAKITGFIEHRAAIIEIQEPDRCPHCQGELDKHTFPSIVHSPQFQQCASPVKTIIDDVDIVLSASDLKSSDNETA